MLGKPIFCDFSGGWGWTPCHISTLDPPMKSYQQTTLVGAELIDKHRRLVRLSLLTVFMLVATWVICL